MTDVWRVLSLLAFLSMTAVAAETPPGPADFKLTIELFGVQKPAIARAELVVRNGLAYQFVSDVPDEVTIVESGMARVQLLDLKRRLLTEVSDRQLDAALVRTRQQALARVDAQVKAGGKANRVSAAMTRDLFDPRFQSDYVAGSHRLRLTNPTVEIDASGEPDADPARLSAIHAGLATVAKLDALREPDGLPPFTRLDAFDAISVGHRLRPTEISVLYRLAGTPKRLRWTYQLVPRLTARENEAIARVDRMRVDARFLPFDRYEEVEEK
jgi:hypothetical protein